MKGSAKIISLILIMLLTICVVLGVTLYKPSVHNASIEELQEINGLGELLSERVVTYLDDNPYADIDDLTDVKGIGEHKLSLIKKKWSD